MYLHDFFFNAIAVLRPGDPRFDQQYNRCEDKKYEGVSNI